MSRTAAHVIPGHTSGRHAGERPRDRVRRGLAELRDRVAASDPGLLRLRQGITASVCVGTALPVQLFVGGLLGHHGTTQFAATLFGAVVAMLGSNFLVGSERWGKVRDAAFFPVAAGIGLIGAAATSGYRPFQVVGFGVVLFAAVWVRRFGPVYFGYGFLVWMGFFFATFLHATWSLVPELFIAALVSTAWVLLLTTTVFRINPRSALRSTMGAFFARCRSVARECVDLLDTPTDGGARTRRAQRALTAKMAGLGEAALLAEAWSVDARAVPEGWSPSALRRRTIEAQQAIERVAAAAAHLHGADHLDPQIRAEARRVLDHLARRRDRAAEVASRRLDRLADAARAAHENAGDGWWSARQLAYGAREFLRFDAAVDDPPDIDPGEAEFEAATALFNGSLPGAPAVAQGVRARGGRLNPVSGLRLSTRQAFQVALAGVVALGLGTVLSPTRYYWAVIAVFVTFSGSGTRSETFLRGMSRIIGTLLGLVGAIALAQVTAGHQDAVIAAILVCIFGAFYLQKVSPTGMAFFITVLLGQLYTVLGTFSDQLLALRLGETAVGALVGVAVALVFAPLSTRDTVRSVRGELMAALAVQLEQVGSYVVGEQVELDAGIRELDDRARRLQLAARPLTRPLVVGHSSAGTRRRLAIQMAMVSQVRALALDVRRRPVSSPTTVQTVCAELARAVRIIAAHAPGEHAPEAAAPLAHAGRLIYEARPATSRSEPYLGPDFELDPVVRHLHHLGGSLTQLSGTHGSITAAQGDGRAAQAASGAASVE